MKQETKQRIAASVENFRLPRYAQIPDVGLYLEQAAKYVAGFLAPGDDMKQETKQRIAASVENFRLPRYAQIPDVGLYLEQAAKYVAGFLAPLGEGALTSSMISNYVKKGLIPSPVKKQYGQEQIAYLFFIAASKSVLSLDALARFIRLQQQTYPLDKAPSPVKKQYGQEQIAYLFFIAASKSVLSLDALARFIRLQQQTYPLDKAYDYFCEEYENLLRFTFELQDTIELSGEDSSDEKRLLYTCVVASVQKIYLEKCLEAVDAEMRE